MSCSAFCFALRSAFCCPESVPSTDEAIALIQPRSSQLTQRKTEALMQIVPYLSSGEVVALYTTCRKLRHKTPIPNIVHLAQAHWSPEYEGDPRMLAEIWNSQKAIANYLLSNPNVAVFQEAWTETTEYQDLPERMKVVANNVFKDGIPSDLEVLSPEVKEWIIKTGVTSILHTSGQLKTLYRSISAEQSSAILEAVEVEYRKGNTNFLSQELKPLIYDQREQALADEVYKYLKSKEYDRNKRIVIVYGAAHDFSEYFKFAAYSVINTTSFSLKR